MRNVQSKTKRIMVRKVRGALAACLLASAAILALLATNLATQQICTPPPANLQNWWTGDATVNDVENNNNGTWQGTESYAPGKVDQAFNFNGSSAVFINSSGNNLVMGTNDFTLDAWVNTTGTATTTRLIFGSGYEAVPGNISNVSLYIDSATNRANFFIRDAAGNSVLATGTRTINDGAWHHLAGSRQGATALIYVDGIQEGSASDQSLGSVDTNCGTAFIGGYNSTAQCATNAIESFFNGLIDEVELVKGRALSDSEIAAIVDAGSAGKCKPVCTTPPPNMVSWWAGDGSATDIQGNNNGTLINDATFAAGKVGQAFSFDGVDDFIQIPDAPDLTPSSITLDAWVKPTTVSTGSRRSSDRVQIQLE